MEHRTVLRHDGVHEMQVAGDALEIGQSTARDEDDGDAPRTRVGNRAPNA
jgi:hypothetical protein